MTTIKQDFATVLTRAGWYGGRNIKSKIENTNLYKIFPTKIQDFLCEFGDLTIHAENKIETIITDTSYLNIQKVFDYYSLNTYISNTKIDLSKNNDLEYYYSTLIGLQLYPVAELIEQSTVFMDENGNFYIINSLPELIWVSNQTFDALTKITFGTNDGAIFNEHTMEWMFPRGKESQNFLPVNPLFKENPW